MAHSLPTTEILAWEEEVLLLDSDLALSTIVVEEMEVEVKVFIRHIVTGHIKNAVIELILASVVTSLELSHQSRSHVYELLSWHVDVVEMRIDDGCEVLAIEFSV